MFANLSRRRVILLVVLTCVLLITLDKRGNPVIDRARGVFSTLIMRPVDTATNTVVLPLQRTWDAITHYDDVKKENEALWDQLQHMRGDDVKAQTAILESQELLRIAALSSASGYSVVLAQVVGVSPSNFQSIVEINVGSARGVKVGMPVTDGAGLIGKITKVFPDHSIVLLATDPSYTISAQILATPEEVADVIANQVPVATTSTTTTTTQPLPFDTSPVTTTVAPTTTGVASVTTTTLLEIIRETGALEGQGSDRPLILRFTDSSSAVTTVHVGAIVNTAGGNSSLAPNGIPIGIVTRVITETGGSNAVVEVTLNARIDRLNFLSVVLFEPNPSAVGR